MADCGECSFGGGRAGSGERRHERFIVARVGQGKRKEMVENSFWRSLTVATGESEKKIRDGRGEKVHICLQGRCVGECVRVRKVVGGRTTQKGGGGENVQATTSRFKTRKRNCEGKRSRFSFLERN